MMRTRRSARLTVGTAVGIALVLTGVLVAGATAPADMWWPSNPPGFGNPDTHYITALGDFQDRIYAGTAGKNVAPGPTQLWRRDGRFGAWSEVRTDGLGNPDNIGIDDLLEFNGKFYAGLWNDADGGEIRRSADGSAWEAVVTGGAVTGGVGNANNSEVASLAAFSGQLYAGTLNMTNGAEIWRSASGEGGTWSAVVTGGNGDAANALITSFEVLNGKLYAGVFTYSGGRVWRTKTGAGGAGDWEDVTPAAGFGANHAVYALGVLGNYLYASTLGDSGTTPYSDSVWRCSTCNGTDWVKVLDGSLLSLYDNSRSGLVTLSTPVCTFAAAAQGAAGPADAEDMLFLIVGNPATGMEVWMTGDGAAGTWGQIGFAGFGDPNNQVPYSDESSTVYRDHLFVGTINKVDGGEIWQFLPCVYPTYVPMVLKH